MLFFFELLELATWLTDFQPYFFSVTYEYIEIYKPFSKQDVSHITQVMTYSMFIISHFKIFLDSHCGFLPRSTFSTKFHFTPPDDTNYAKTDQDLWVPFYISNKPDHLYLKCDSFRENQDNHLPKCSATHPIVSSPIGSPDDESYLGNIGTGYSGHHLGTILGNSFSFIVSTNHKS